MPSALFHDRSASGRVLAKRLEDLTGNPNVVVLALPRGGVPVAFEVARALKAPLDVFVVRKLGAPEQEELAMGAVATGGAVVLNRPVIAQLQISRAELQDVIVRERAEVERRTRAYRGDTPVPALRGRVVVLVDDGVATGSTMAVAVNAVRQFRPEKVIVAAPVMSSEALAMLRRIADRCVTVAVPEHFGSVGAYYDDFTQTTDEEVWTLLGRPSASADSPAIEAVHIPCGSVTLDGDLQVPAGARGLIVFAHGSGSSRRSPRNQQVAARLHAQGFATLLFDLLSPAEDRRDRETKQLRFDIELLADRLVRVTDWLSEYPRTNQLEIGYFGASTGAAAALVAAARRPDVVQAVVSRGGRPDLAGAALTHVAASTLLIVGGADPEVLVLNRAAARRLGARLVRIREIPGATHLFEEPGALEQVADLAGDWFTSHVGRALAGAG